MNLLNSKKEFRLSSDLFIGFILTFLLSFTSCLEKLESKVIEGPFFKGSNNFYYIEDNDTLVFNKKDSMLIGIKTANASIGFKVEDGDENGILYHEYRLEQTYKIFIDSNLFVYSLRARFPFDRDGYIYYDLKNDSISGLLLFDLVSDDFNKSKIFTSVPLKS